MSNSAEPMNQPSNSENIQDHSHKEIVHHEQRQCEQNNASVDSSSFSVKERDDSIQDLLSIIKREKKKLYQNLTFYDINKTDKERKHLYERRMENLRCLVLLSTEDSN